MVVKTVREAPLRNERRYMENRSIAYLCSEKYRSPRLWFAHSGAIEGRPQECQACYAERFCYGDRPPNRLWRGHAFNIFWRKLVGVEPLCVPIIRKLCKTMPT